MFLRKLFIIAVFIAVFQPVAALCAEPQAANFRAEVRDYLFDRYSVSNIVGEMKERWGRAGPVYKQTLSLDEREDFVTEARKTLRALAANMFYDRDVKVIYLYNKDSTYWFILELNYMSRGNKKIKSRYLKGKLVAHPFSEKLRRAGNMMDTHADFVVSAFSVEEITKQQTKSLIMPYPSQNLFVENYVKWRNSISTDISQTEQRWFGDMSPIRLMSSEKIYKKFEKRAREAIEIAKIDNMTRDVKITGSENLANNLWRVTFVTTDIFIDKRNLASADQVKDMQATQKPVVKHWGAFLRLAKQTHKFDQGNYALLMVSSYALKRNPHAQMVVTPATTPPPAPVAPDEYKNPPDENFDDKASHTNYVF